MQFHSSWRDDYATLDHVKTKREGGTRHESNARLAHKLCNEMRGSGAAGRNKPMNLPGEYACLGCRQYFLVTVSHECLKSGLVAKE